MDVNPTVADVLGLPPSPSWHGRSLFDRLRPPRAYFYAANDDYLLGVREGDWKYIYNATEGRDELYDLKTDPAEGQNTAKQEEQRVRRLQAAPRRMEARRGTAAGRGPEGERAPAATPPGP